MDTLPWVLRGSKVEITLIAYCAIVELLPYETLMATLRERRRELGVQQKWVAGQAGISAAYLSRMENGNTNANYATVYAVWRVLRDREVGDQETAADLMTPAVSWVAVDDSWRTARETMFENDYSQLPVRDGDRSVGSITERTLLDNHGEERRVGDMMGAAFIEVRPDTTRDAVAALLRDENDALLVTDGDEYVGIVTAMDLI